MMHDMDTEERSVTVIDSTPGTRQIASVKEYVVLLVTGTLIAVIGLGIWEVRQYIAVIGYIALVLAAICLLAGVSLVIAFVIRYWTRAHYYEMGEHGGYVRTMFGRLEALAPMNAASVSVKADKRGAKTTIVTPTVPTIYDLLEAGEIAPGTLEMVMGYDKKSLDQGRIEIIKGTWPGTFAIAGKGRSGKTRRVIFLIAQALISGAKITVCDPHASKPDSLARALEPLASWLTIARNEQEIVLAAREFFNEMESRVSGISTEIFDQGNNTPRLIVFDEWSRLMTTDRIEDEDRELLIKVAEGCSREYAGYNGYACLISQTWTQDACGGTSIRRSLHVAFIHNISAEYAAFFVRARKLQAQAEELKRRECLYKDYEGTVITLITPGVPDDTSVRIADYMRTIAPAPARDLLTSTSTARDLPGDRREQLASYSPSHEIDTSELENNYAYARGETVTPLVERRNSSETVTVTGETFTMHQADRGEQLFTHEQETAILIAAFQIIRQTGKITRSDIMERLGWTRKQWPIIKAVCDRHNIAKQ